MSRIVPKSAINAVADSALPGEMKQMPSDDAPSPAPLSLPRVSIIIPTLNEESCIAATLDRCIAEPATEILVVDGGSTDATTEIVVSYGLKPSVTSPSRGGQLNMGANNAVGDVLLFLHADTLPPVGFASIICDALRDTSVIAGAFRLRIGEHGIGYRVIEHMANRRTRRRQLPFGDQGIFLRRETFMQVGGFPDIPVMEDAQLMKRLRCDGRVVLLEHAITTSARRWKRNGLIRTTLQNQWYTAAFACGYPAGRIARARNRRSR